MLYRENVKLQIVGPEQLLGYFSIQNSKKGIIVKDDDGKIR